MITLMSAIRRRPGLSRAEFVAYLRDVHGAIAVKEPLQLWRYVQNHVTDAVAGVRGDERYGVAPDRDNVTELVFEDFPALGATMGAAYSRDIVGPDGANFSDLSTAYAVLVDHVEQPVPRPGPGAVKVFEWLHAADGVQLAEFGELLTAAHAEVARSGPDLLGPVRALVHHRQLPQGAPLLQYFGGQGVHVYEGVLSLRLDDPAGALAVAQNYTAALAAAAPRPFFDPSHSFTLVADEVVILDRTSSTESS